MNISFWDLLICVVLTAFSVIYTVILTRKKNDKDLYGYLLFGRKLTLPLFVATLVSTWYGDIFGVTQIAFKNGIYGLFAFGIPFYLSAFIFMLFFVEKARKIEAFSVPNIFAKLYGYKTGKISALMIVIKSLPVTYAIGIGVLIKNVTGLELCYSIILGVGIVITYIGVKGFGGIIYSDAIQFILMFSAALAVVAVSYVKYGGLSFLQEKLEPRYFSIEDKETFSKIIVWLFLGFIATVMSPIFYQRCFAAASTKTAKKGILIAIFCWIVFDMTTVLGGMYAKAVFYDSAPHEAYFLYCIKVLPIGLKGLYLAGIIATILSTLDSFLFLNSSTILIDLFGEKYLKKHFAKIISILFSAALTIFFSLQFSNSIEEYYLILRSYSAVPLAFPLLFTILFKRSFSERQIIFCILSTVAVMLANDTLFLGIKSFYLGCIYNFGILVLCHIYNFLRNKRYK